MKAFCVVRGHILHTGFVSEAEKSEALNLDALTLFELEGEEREGGFFVLLFDYMMIVCSQKCAENRRYPLDTNYPGLFLGVLWGPILSN